MLHGIGRNDDVAHFQVFIKTAGDTGVDQHIHLIQVHQKLGADGHIYFTDAALYDNSVDIPKNSLIKSHPRDCLLFPVFHLSDQRIDLLIHGTDDTYTNHICLQNQIVIHTIP